jgi:hypothetical protein
MYGGKKQFGKPKSKHRRIIRRIVYEGGEWIHGGSIEVACRLWALVDAVMTSGDP